MQRANIAGLRSSDPTTLSILTQDLIRKPLVQLHPSCLCDLIALSEAEGIGKILARDLGRFRDQMIREINDMPEGDVLGTFLTELTEVEAPRIPASIRVAVLDRGEAARRNPRSTPQMDAIEAHFASGEVKPVVIGERTKVAVQQFDVPDSHKAPDERKGRRAAVPKSKSAGGAKRTAKPKPPPVPKRMVDPKRAHWIRADLLDRLNNYGGSGLKQAILIAGCRHRAPWEDVTGDEIMSVLRALAKDGKLKHSAGRWSRTGRY